MEDSYELKMIAGSYYLEYGKKNTSHHDKSCVEVTYEQAREIDAFSIKKYEEEQEFLKNMLSNIKGETNQGVVQKHLF